MGVRRKNSTKVQFSVLDCSGRIAVGLHGSPLILPNQKAADTVAKAIGGTVGQVNVDSREMRGRTTDPRVINAWRDWEFALTNKKGKKPRGLIKRLCEKYYGPFNKTAPGRRALEKKCDSLERLIRKMHLPWKKGKLPYRRKASKQSLVKR